MTCRQTCALTGLLFIALSSQADDWPQYRGPNGSGVSPSINLPERFDAKTNLVWRKPLPPGHSSPVFTKDRIFLTALDGEAQVTISLDRATGKELWRREAPRLHRETHNRINGPASATPVTDGVNVYVFLGDFGLLSYSTDGRERWRLPLGPFVNQHGPAASPILADGKLVLVCDQDSGSYMIAVDAATGRVAWKTMRPEYTRGYATPGVYRPKTGGAQLIVPGSYELAAYALHTGEKLWWVRGLAWQLKSLPVIDGDTIYFNGWEPYGDVDQPDVLPEFSKVLAEFDANNNGSLEPSEKPAYYGAGLFREADLNRDGRVDAKEWLFARARSSSINALFAIRAGGRGDVTESNVLWTYRKSLPNTATPLLYKDVLWLIKDGILTTLHPVTGAVFKQARLTAALGTYWGAPVGADGKVFLSNEDGKVVVVKADPEWEVLAVNDLDETNRGTVAILGGRLYLRTEAALYCWERKR
jgi:outer membrane protein assembly factor BamB